jgi:NADPH2 dehydrogenase
MAAEYYGQRASVPGTLLVSEATIIAEPYGGYPNVPGIYTQAHIDAWKKITDAVHEKKSFIYLQLWALGRVANKEFLAAKGIPLKSASAIAVDSDHAEPEEMTQDDIKAAVAAYAQAAKTSAPTHSVVVLRTVHASPSKSHRLLWMLWAPTRLVSD